MKQAIGRGAACLAWVWLAGCSVAKPTIAARVVRFDATALVVDIQTTPGALVRIDRVSQKADDSGHARLTLDPGETRFDDAASGGGTTVAVDVLVEGLTSDADTHGVVRLPYDARAALALDGAQALAIVAPPEAGPAVGVVGDLVPHGGEARVIGTDVVLGLIGPRGTVVAIGGARAELVDGFAGDPLEAPLARATLRVPVAAVLADLPATALTDTGPTTRTLAAQVTLPATPEAVRQIGLVIEATDLPGLALSLLATVAHGPAPWVARPSPTKGLALVIDVGAGHAPAVAIGGVPTLAEVDAVALVTAGSERAGKPCTFTVYRTGLGKLPAGSPAPGSEITKPNRLIDGKLTVYARDGKVRGTATVVTPDACPYGADVDAATTTSVPGVNDAMMLARALLVPAGATAAEAFDQLFVGGGAGAKRAGAPGAGAKPSGAAFAGPFAKLALGMPTADLDRRLAELAWSGEVLALGVSIDEPNRTFRHTSGAWTGMFETDGNRFTGLSARIQAPIDLAFLTARWGKPSERWDGDLEWRRDDAFTATYVQGTSGAAFAWRPSAR